MKRLTKSITAWLLVMILSFSCVSDVFASGSLMDFFNAGDAYGWSTIKAAQKVNAISAATVGDQAIAEMEGLGASNNNQQVCNYIQSKVSDKYTMTTLDCDGKKQPTVSMPGGLTKVTKSTLTSKKDYYQDMAQGDTPNTLAGSCAYEGNSASAYKGASAVYKAKNQYYTKKNITNESGNVTGYKYVGHDYYIKGTVNQVALSSTNFPAGKAHAMAWTITHPGVYVSGIDSISITWSFYSDKACTKPIDISGYFINKDIDAQQGVMYGNNVKKILYSPEAKKKDGDNTVSTSAKGKLSYLSSGTLDGRAYVYALGANNTTHNGNSDILKTAVACCFEGNTVTSCWTFAKCDVADMAGNGGNDNGGNGYMGLEADTGWKAPRSTTSTAGSSCFKGIYAGDISALNAAVSTADPAANKAVLDTYVNVKSANFSWDPNAGTQTFTYIVKASYKADLVHANANYLNAATRINVYDTIPDYLQMLGGAQVYVYKGNNNTFVNQTGAKFTVRYDTCNAKTYNGAGTGVWTPQGSVSPSSTTTMISAKYGGNDQACNGADYGETAFSGGMDVYLCIPVKYRSEADYAALGTSVTAMEYVDGAGFLQQNTGSQSSNIEYIAERKTDSQGNVTDTYASATSEYDTDTVNTYATYSAKISIHKSDGKGNALAGATFPLFAYNNVYGEYIFTGSYFITDANGNAQLPVGPSSTNPGCDFAFVEQGVPSGYQMNKTFNGAEVHFIDGNNTTWMYKNYTSGWYDSDHGTILNAGSDVVGDGIYNRVDLNLVGTNLVWQFTNPPKTFNIKVRKAAAEDPSKSLAGFKFKLGNAYSTTATEITLTDNGDGTYSYNNIPLDKFSPKTPQAAWTVYEAEVSDTRNKDTIATDSDNPTVWAKNFTIDPSGADGQTVVFDYGAEGATANGPVNTAKRSTVKVIKKDSETKKPVAGATYAIMAKKDVLITDYASGSAPAIMDYTVIAPCDIYDKDGNLLHKKDDIITEPGQEIKAGIILGYVTTDKNGEATLDQVTVTYKNGKSEKVNPLFGGNYFVREVDPAEGYLLSEKEYDFSVANNKIETVEVDVENDPIKPGLAVSKIADKTLVATSSGEAVSSSAALNEETGEYEGTRLTKTYVTGDKVLYTINVTNTGNVPLENINVEDYIDNNFNVVSNEFVLNEGGAYTTAKNNTAKVSFVGEDEEDDPTVSADAENKAEITQILSQAADGNTDGNVTSGDAAASGDASGDANWLPENDVYSTLTAKDLALKSNKIKLDGLSALEGVTFSQYATAENGKQYLIGKTTVKNGMINVKTSKAYKRYILTADDEVNGYDTTDLYLAFDSDLENAVLDWESENLTGKNIVVNDGKVDLPSIAAGKNIVTTYKKMNDKSKILINHLAVGDSLQLQYLVTLEKDTDKNYDSLYNLIKANGQYTDNYKYKLVQDKGTDIIRLIEPGVAVSKLANRTTGAKWNQDTGRYDGEKKPGQYVAGETVDFRIDATNTGKVTLYNTKITDTPTQDLLAYMVNGQMKFDLNKSKQYGYDAKGNPENPEETITMTANNTTVSYTDDASGDAADVSADAERAKSPIVVKVNGKKLTRSKDYSLKVISDYHEDESGTAASQTNTYVITGKNDYDGGVTAVPSADGFTITTNNAPVDEIGTAAKASGDASGNASGNATTNENSNKKTNPNIFHASYADALKLDTKNTTVNVKDNHLTVKYNGKTLENMEDYIVSSKVHAVNGKTTITYTVKGILKYTGGVEVTVKNNNIENFVNYDTYVNIPDPEIPAYVELGTLTTKKGYTVTAYLVDNYTVVVDKLTAGDSVALCLTGTTKTDVSNTKLLENNVDITSTYLTDEVYTKIDGEPDKDAIYMINPSTTPAKIADRTTGATFNAATGRFDGEKISGTYAAGETITWTLYATNTGDCQLYNLKLTDTNSDELKEVLEEGSEYYDFSSGDTLTSANGKNVVATINADNSVTFDTLEAHDYVTIKYSAVVKKKIKKSDGLKNKVDLTAQYLLNGTPVDITGTPDEDKVNIIVPGVSVAKKANKTKGAKFNRKTGLYEGEKETGTYKIGETVDFTIIATNTLSTKLYNITITDTMDKKLTKALDKAGFVETKEIETADGNTAKVTYKNGEAVINELEPGDYVKLHFTGVVKQYISGKLNNKVHVTAQYKVNDELVDIDGNNDHDSILIKEPPKGTPDHAKTGDSFHFGILIGLLAAAIGGIISVFIYRKRRFTI